MKASRQIFLTALLGLASSLHAQLAVYGKGDLNRYTLNETSPSSTYTFHGAGVGIYDDFLHLGPVRFGMDVRGDLETTDKLQYQSVLAGFRVVGKLPVLPFRPYAEALIGEGGTRDKGPYAVGITNVPYAHKLTYALLTGLDWSIFPHIDFRVLEIGYGRQSESTGFNTTTSDSMLLLSSGVVVRFW
jgi:hypothetical protein